MAMDSGEGPSEPEEPQILGDCCRKLQEGWAALADSFIDKINEVTSSATSFGSGVSLPKFLWFCFIVVIAGSLGSLG